MVRTLLKMGVISLTVWRLSWKMVIFEFLYIFSFLCIVLGDNFLGFFPFALGPRRQLLKTKLSTAAILFSRWPPCNFWPYRCCKWQLLLPIHVLSGKNPIDFQWVRTNNMAAMGRFVKCDIGIANLNSGMSFYCFHCIQCMNFTPYGVLC